MGTREYVGAGGMHLHLDEPLSPQMVEQVAKGRLHPVAEAAAAEDAQEAPPAGGDDAQADRPAKNAPVADWRAYAVALGMSEDDAVSATKQECQDYVQVLDDTEAQE